MKPVLLVTGSCQAEVVTVILRRVQALTSTFDIVFHEVGSDATLLESLSSRCRLVYATPTHDGIIGAEQFGPNCHYIVFPPLQLARVWPFTVRNPHNYGYGKRFPHGRLPYGDEIIAERARRGWSVKEIFDYYLSAWDEYSATLARYYEFDNVRMETRHAQTDLPMWTFIKEQYRTQRLFLTVNHPTNALFGELVKRLLAASGGALARVSPALVESIMQNDFKKELLGSVEVPVHPKIALTQGLTWYDPAGGYRNGPLELDYEAYLRELIELAVASQGAMQDRRPKRAAAGRASSTTAFGARLRGKSDLS